MSEPASAPSREALTLENIDHLGRRMKRTIRTLGWRLVMDYTSKCYVPAAGGTSSDMSFMR